MARPMAKDHDAKRTHILRAAARIFATDGYDRASMSQLAQECGTSKANIYHYYDGKDAILYDVLETYLRRLRDRICGLSLDGLTPEDQLLLVVRDVLLAYEGSDHEHRVQITGVDRLPEERQGVLKGYQKDMVRFLSEVLSGVAAHIGADKDQLRATTMSVFGMLNWYYMWNSGAGAAEREDYARLVTNLTLRGIVNPTPPRT